MMLFTTLVLATAVGMAPPPQQADTLRITRQVERRIAQHEKALRQAGVLATWKKAKPNESCSADAGQTCFGVSALNFPCLPDVRCQPQSWSKDMGDFMLKSAEEHSDAGLVAGFATWFLMGFGRQMDAFNVASNCAATGWWCSLIQGYVYRGVGRVGEAERSFRAGLTAAPDSVRCWFTLTSWILPPDIRRRLQTLSCSARLAALDTVWWLADPSFAGAGNQRWTDHVARVLDFRFHQKADSIYERRPYPDWYRDSMVSFVVPRGEVDSWRRLAHIPPRGWAFHEWTSLKAARYHFVPDFPDNDLAHPVWRINGTIDDEGYTPPDAKYYALPAQLARFRQGDTTVVAVGGDLTGSTLAHAANATAHLVLSDGPSSFPVHLTSPFHDGRAVFLAPAPAGRYVASYEVLAPGEVGRHRVMMEPLDTEGPGVSDLLLYQPLGDLEPDSLRMAAALMLGTDTVEAGDQLGVYWETYGAGKDTPVQVELEVRKEGGGLIATLKRLLPGGGEEGPGRLSWSEPSTGEVFPRAVVLDLEGLGSGSYTLVVRTTWAGQKALETQRTFVVR